MLLEEQLKATQPTRTPIWWISLLQQLEREKWDIGPKRITTMQAPSSPLMGALGALFRCQKMAKTVPHKSEYLAFSNDQVTNHCRRDPCGRGCFLKRELILHLEFDFYF